MSNTIIGTAGHVDHGKTQLIKALTGIDTDSHKQEKERGITIELGFAYLTLPNGERCGIIDVPGHEKFVRNMLAGAGSIDLVLFVIACNEGMMPQSREHLSILSLLGIKRGVIALTKIDLFDKDWVDMIALDIAEQMRGTFLESAPIIPVSSLTGVGISELKDCLSNIILTTPEIIDTSPARLPIDRVFSVDGFGTVVTGTLTEGKLSVGDDLVVYPLMHKTKVRNLQVHGKNVQTANRSQRVAVNLAGLKVEDVTKGSVLAFPGSLCNTKTLDVRLDIINDTKRKILNNSRLHFFHGTTSTLCKLVFLDKDVLLGGESGYAQLHLDSEICAKPNDHFVVRFYSPLETVGGGIILDPNPLKRKRKDNNAKEMFKTKEKGSFIERLACFVFDKSKDFPNVSELKLTVFSNTPEFDTALAQLVDRGDVFIIKNYVIHKSFLNTLLVQCKQILSKFHSQSPLLEGMRKDELRTRLLPNSSQSVADIIIDFFEKSNSIIINGNIVSNVGYKVAKNDNYQKLHDEILSAFMQAGFSPPSIDDLLLRYQKDQKAFKHTIDSLVQSGILVFLTSQIFMHCDYYNKAINIFSQLAEKKEVTLAEFRDSIASSRKYAVALLELFDKKGISKKEGDARILIKKS